MCLRGSLPRGLGHVRILHIGDRQNPVDDQLRRLFIPHGDASVQNHRRIFIQHRAILAEHAREYQQLHRTGVVLDRDVGHHGAGFRGLHLDGLDDPGDVHDLLILIGILAVFKAFQDLTDRHDVHSAQQRPVIVHRVAGKIQAGRLFFQAHFLLRAQLRDIRHRDGRHGRRRILTGNQVEQAHLTLDIFAFLVGCGVHDQLVHAQHLRTIEPEAIAGAGLDEVFQRAFVEVCAVHAQGEILKAREFSVLLALVHDLQDEAAPDVLDGGQTEADAARHDGEVVVRFVDIRRQERNVHGAAFGDILGDLDRAVQD